MLTSQELTNLLRERGYKVTPQRLAVYEALADETWHPNAEMLFNKLQPKFPAMSFATVYPPLGARRHCATRNDGRGELSADGSSHLF